MNMTFANIKSHNTSPAGDQKHVCCSTVMMGRGTSLALVVQCKRRHYVDDQMNENLFAFSWGILYILWLYPYRTL